MYLDTWRESLIPLCANKSGSTPTLCSEFKPSLSNQGMCFTKNQGPVDDIYKSTPYITTFNKTLLVDREQFLIPKNMGSGMRYKTSFLINANQVMDLKKGLKWNETKRATFRVAIHPNFDMPEIRDTGIKVFAGYKTTIRVNTMQLESEENVKEKDDRRCKFETEHDDLSLFKTYSR